MAETTMKETTMKETSQKIGQALARSSHKFEEASKKAQDKMGDVVDTVSQKAKDVMHTLGKIEEDTSAPSCPFRINTGKSLEGQIGETAGVIYEYLTKNNTVPTSRLVNAVMRQRQHTQANVYAALGWMMREEKLEFTEDGAMVRLR
ncbi:MAG: winged helix-turn-helix domain-containing protein [Desulfobulbaceae bacterium]|jgi:hypothetical protein|nr:winged helix-turn-helix domain-containing protein [Desulfobulbaceae bacterium]